MNTLDWTLIAKSLAGDATPEEQAALQEWLAAHPEDQQAFAEADVLWQQARPASALSAAYLDAQLEQMNARIAQLEAEGLDWSLVAKQLAGESTAEEDAYLDAWLAAHPEEADLLTETEQLWQAAQPGKLPSSYLDGQLSAMHAKLDALEAAAAPVVTKAVPTPKLTATRTRKRRPVYWAAAAAVLVAMFAGWWAVQPAPEAPVFAQMEVITPVGKHQTVILPDGTEVTLNSSTTLRYPQQFANDARTVELSGEAFFDVTEDAARPFTIRTTRTQTQVLGTSFSLTAYPDEPNETLVVATGKVAFSDTKTNERVEVTPNQKAVLSAQAGSIRTEDVVAQEYIAWVNQTLKFEDARISSIAKALEKHFQVNIAVQDNKLARRKISGQFDGRSLEDILLRMSKIVAFEYQISGRQVTLGYDLQK